MYLCVLGVEGSVWHGLSNPSTVSAVLAELLSQQHAKLWRLKIICIGLPCNQASK